MFKLFLADLKMMSRNRQALLWVFMFPLMFTFIFGFFFGKNSSAGTIGLINNSNSELSGSIEKSLIDSNLFNVVKIADETTAKEQIKKTKISAAIEIPSGFGQVSPGSPTSITLIEDQGNSQVNSILSGFLNTFLTNANYQATNTKPIFTIKPDMVSNRTLSYFDFVLAGILGLALMNSSIIGIAVAMTDYREKQILKRITTTPLKTWRFILAEVFSRLILNFFQISLILIIGKYIFNAHIYGNIFIVFLIAIMAALLFQLIGFAVATIAKTTDAAQGMATAIAVPMMFLSGVFFPIDSLPKWLMSIVQFLPLAPVLRILRGTILEGFSPFENPINMVIVITWIVVCLAYASLRFRLSDE